MRKRTKSNRHTSILILPFRILQGPSITPHTKFGLFEIYLPLRFTEVCFLELFCLCHLDILIQSTKWADGARRSLHKNLCENDIERITDPSASRHRHERILDSLLMIGLVGLERDVAEVPISNFRYTSPYEVIQIKRDCTIRYCLITRGTITWTANHTDAV